MILISSISNLTTNEKSQLNTFEFLQALYKDIDTGCITLSVFQEDKHYQSIHVPVKELYKAANIIKNLSSNSNVYFGVGVRKEGLSSYQRGSKQDVISIPALFLEIDISGGQHQKSALPTEEEAMSVLNTFSLYPNLINHSGGGLHVYYMLEEPFIIENEKQREEIGNLLKRLENVIHALLKRKGKVADSVAELARVLRPAGTFNHKYSPVKEVNTIHHEEQRYSLEEITEAIEEFEDMLQIEKQETKLNMNVEAKSPKLTDAEVLQKAFHAKNGDRIKRLYEGDISTYESHSEADLALCNYLSYYTQNPNQLDRLFIKSALYRPEKWDRKDYKTSTIQKAINGRTSFYQGKGSNDFSLHVKDSASMSLKEQLTKRRFEELERMEQEWKDNDKRGRKPTTISPVRCSIILPEYINFILFDLEENTRLAMYLKDEGIYTRNTTIIKRVISWLEPKLNSHKADEVIYHLTNRAEVREQTESRYLIPVANGIFNLKTRKLEPFSPDYVFTTKISTPYVENPSNPVIDGWDVETWLNSIACGDGEIVHLLWQVINDSLNGNYTRRKAIFLIGEGNNGKGTFQELITNLIGMKNIATLKINEFDERFKLSVLEGKTAVIGDDVPAGVHIDDSSNFNSVVTGDVVSVEMKNKPIYNTSFKCSVIQSTNGMPKFRNKTNGTIRRLVIVPFKANFDGEKENPKIKNEYIKNEKVLQYVLHKAINMDFESFDIPQVSLNELEVFKQDNDPVLDFKVSVFDEWKIQKVPKYVVYGFYKKFCLDNSYKALSERQFHKRLKTYLSSDWITDAQGKYHYETLMKDLGDLDLLGIGFPDQSQNLRSYENIRLKAI